MKNEIAAEIEIVMRMIIRSVEEIWAIWEMALAAPVLVLFVRKRVTNEMDITNVLIEPINIRNCFWEISPVISEPMIAA